MFNLYKASGHVHQIGAPDPVKYAAATVHGCRHPSTRGMSLAFIRDGLSQGDIFETEYALWGNDPAALAVVWEAEFAPAYAGAK